MSRSLREPRGFTMAGGQNGDGKRFSIQGSLEPRVPHHHLQQRGPSPPCMLDYNPHIPWRCCLAVRTWISGQGGWSSSSNSKCGCKHEASEEVKSNVILRMESWFNRIASLQEETPKSLPSSLPTCACTKKSYKHTTRCLLSTSRKRRPQNETYPAGTLTLDFPGSRTVRKWIPVI